MMRNRSSRACAALLLLAACAPSQAPVNTPEVAKGAAYQAQYRAMSHARDRAEALSSARLNARKCNPADSALAAAPAVLEEERLSPGDLLRIDVGRDGVFSGDFEVARDGRLKPPHMAPLPARGHSAESLSADLRERLVRGGFYPAPGPRVSVRVVSFAPVKVAVAGAVFETMEVVIGPRGPIRGDGREEASGAHTETRNISAALRAAGGVRPDADLAQVRIIRNGAEHVLDLSGAQSGDGIADVMLLAGDRVIVPSRGCFQEALMRPSSITAPGVKVFMSNLTKPADANALSAVGKEARELRYGSRFLQAVVGMNCVGRSKLTNADRSAVLFTRDPETGRSIVIERRIEDLLRGERRDELDPYILPGDALACYDSAVTDITELARSLGVVVGAGLFLSL